MTTQQQVIDEFCDNLKLDIAALEARAERAEALLADERNRVANLKAELAARPAVTEETVQAIADLIFPVPGWKRGDGTVHDCWIRWVNRHLLPATPEPVPVGVFYCPQHDYFCDENLRNRCGPGNYFYETWKNRRHEFPQSREEAERRGKPDLVMTLIEDLQHAEGIARGSFACKLREAIRKEREAGR